MSCRSRGMCVAALLISLSWVAKSLASETLANGDSPSRTDPLATIPSSALPFDAEALLHPNSLIVTHSPPQPQMAPGELPNELLTPDLSDWPTSAVPHPSPPPSAFDSDKPAPREDLMVPFPALGAGWVLLLGGVLCKIGARAVRPN